MDHAIREEMPLWEGGYPFPTKKGAKTIPRIVCGDCYAAMHVEGGE
jgi:hypothetical protein